MARIIQFYTPSKLSGTSKFVPRSQAGKVIRFYQPKKLA
jgi:hypothetical protein